MYKAQKHKSKRKIRRKRKKKSWQEGKAERVFKNKTSQTAKCVCACTHKEKEDKSTPTCLWRIGRKCHFPQFVNWKLLLQNASCGITDNLGILFCLSSPPCHCQRSAAAILNFDPYTWRWKFWHSKPSCLEKSEAHAHKGWEIEISFSFCLMALFSTPTSSRHADKIQPVLISFQYSL